MSRLACVVAGAGFTEFRFNLMEILAQDLSQRIAVINSRVVSAQQVADNLRKVSKLLEGKEAHCP
jgi:prefoldin subunit 5